MSKAWLLFLWPFTVLFAPGQSIQRINPSGLSHSPAYTQVVTAKPGRVVWISGQVAQNAKAKWWAKGT
jgi:enamine deaminase RidA (YjgF/YER057c/UK114 family)